MTRIWSRRPGQLIRRQGVAVERYVFMYGSEPWPPGITTLQLYAPVSLELNPELAELLPRWRAALEGAPVGLVQDKDLHVTIDMISDAPGGDITAAERTALADAIRQGLAGTPAYRGRIGGALAYRSGAILDISPAEPLRQLHLTLRRAIHSVRGPSSTQYRVPKAHASIAYATGTANSDDYQSRLRQVDPNNAPLRLDEVQLVELHMDHQAGQVWWTTVASFPLAKPTAEAPAPDSPIE